MTDPNQLQTSPALERLLSDIYIRMRQGKFPEAKEGLAKAKEMAPDHPAVIEIEGDIAFAQGRFTTAKQLYKQALEINPKNGKLEEKFATALIKSTMPQLLTHQVADDSLWSNRVPRNPFISMVLSVLLPGFGQIYNGDWLKGLLLMLASVFGGLSALRPIVDQVYAYVKNQQEFSFSAIGTVLRDALHGPNIILVILLFAIWLYSVIDAWYIAKNTS